MKKVMGAVLAIVATLVFPVAGWAESSRYISVTGEAQIRVVPNEITVCVGVVTRDPMLSNAVRQNDERVKSVWAVTSEYQIPSRCVQTNYLNVEPRYEEQGGKPVGYAVTKQMIITVKDVERFDDFVKSVLEAGANYVNGIDFKSSEIGNFKSQARASAAVAAKSKAEHLAKAMRQKIGKIQMIREENNAPDWSASTLNSSNSIQNYGSSGSEVGETFALGQITVRARVTVEFELLDWNEKM